MSYFINKQKQYIAFNKTIGSDPGIIFIHGYNSDMSGEKAKYIEKYAKLKKISFVKFDCRGHGKSYGKIEEFVISDWKKDLLDIIDNKTKGPQLLIGSSMGGWLMMLAAKLRKTRICGLIGIAAAPDFTKDLYKSLSKKNKLKLQKNKVIKVRKWNYTYIWTKKLFSDGNKNLILNKKFSFNKPIILLHGLKDSVVPIDVPQKILKIIPNNNIELRLIKNGDHSLSKKNDLKKLINSIEYILKK
ncbi:MAG: alpha/beta hydrolase [Pelagibacteraceae bacterium]|nr:alpha/beta hydrolase [Pelagibacteraceae bacterium]|tara:strand:- start:972 stop:1703 length:732 start_codon:yes stop_codon:yes gene_type:complete